MTEKRDDEELFFIYILDGRCWKVYHKRQTPKNNDLSTMAMQPAGSEQQEQDKIISFKSVFTMAKDN